MVGAPAEPLDVPAFSLIMRRRSFSGSAIGGIAETQEMLDFCGKHKIIADVEVMPIQKVNEAYERLLKSDVKYRFSIDMAFLKAESSTPAREARFAGVDTRAKTDCRTKVPVFAGGLDAR